jgi:hypothetical protein
MKDFEVGNLAFSFAIVDGLLVVRPTRAQIEALQVGDIGLDCFGHIARVKEIFARGICEKDGRSFVCTYLEFGDNRGSISHSFKEGEIVPTIPLISRFHRIDSIDHRAIRFSS